MPSNTVTEHRDRNPRGRDKRKLHRKRTVSPFQGKVGNSGQLKGCSHCNAKLAQRVERTACVNRVCREQFKSIVQGQPGGFVESGSDTETE